MIFISLFWRKKTFFALPILKNPKTIIKPLISRNYYCLLLPGKYGLSTHGNHSTKKRESMFVFPDDIIF